MNKLSFKEYERRIKKSYEDFWKHKRELDAYYPAGPDKIWDFDDENMCMRKLKLPDCEWEKFEEPNDELNSDA